MKFISFLCILYLVSCSDNRETYSDEQLQKDSISIHTDNLVDLTYSCAVLGEFFSIKIDSAGNAYTKVYRPHYLKRDTTYFAVLNFNQKKKFDSLMNGINFTKIDSVYEDHNVDGEDYRIYLSRGSENKFTYIHLLKIPAELRELVEFTFDVKNESKFFSVDTVIFFKSNHIKQR